MLVIGMAVLAIVAAVVIMVLPQDSKKSGKKIGAPPPAPERMDVDPTNPKSSQLTPPQGSDPWAAPDDLSPHWPTPQPPPSTHIVPDPDNDDDNDVLRMLGGPGGTNILFGMYDHACTKFKSCPGANASTFDLLCDQFSAYKIAPSTCPAAKRCFDAIDRLPCDQTDDASSVTSVTSLLECTTAIQDC